MKHCLRTFTASAVATACLLIGCERDFSATPGGDDLRFSADTLSFDTLYAGYSSPTGRITLRNVGDYDVTVGRVFLEGGDVSDFSVNINGLSATEATNMRLGHGDSLYIFVSVRNAKALEGRAFNTLTDHIVAQGGANTWRATVTAVVRNVTAAPLKIESDTQWLCDTIPYLVRDTLDVAEGATLLVGPGVTVLMEKAAAICVAGNMAVAGEVDNRTSFSPLRSDGYYETIPGQWGGIIVSAGGRADIRFADVACSASGIACDSASTVFIDGLWVRDVSHTGVTLNKVSAEVRNTIVSDCGGGAFNVTGGDVRLRHVTVSDYFSWDYRHVSALQFNHTEGETSKLTVYNSIIFGNQTSEIAVDSLSAEFVTFRSSLLKMDKKTVSKAEDVFIDCKLNNNAHFANRSEADYHLTSQSDAVGLADPALTSDMPTDIEGTLRVDGEPWNAGALQTVTEEE